MKRTITTVICAVWHNDPDRHRLLLQHCENCRGQTTSVNVIYVFDNNDRPPPSFRESAIISSEPLTIYEAWNLALAACRTPYVMNLNLDDRLCADAVEQLEDRVQEADAWLIGGDWKICHSQEETNEVGKCYPAHDIPFSSDWPPKKGVATRLGSGTGNRGTFGPATLWRMECHIRFPRYPYRTASGEKIRTIGDAIWWTCITRSLNRRAVRVPLIIGNYHSHPESQAEFRNAGERALLATQKISLL